ncbi:MAG: ABC transporter substrate-binding protein [Saprospiraceae bacterium]
MARTNKDVNSAHLIIGPYLRSNATILAEKARSNGSILVSPHSASANISPNNPNYIQVKPSLETHCQAIMQHVAKDHSYDQIVLVALNNDAEKARFDYLQKAWQITNGNTDTRELKRITVDSNRLEMGSVDLAKYFTGTGETVFIVPSWSKETFIYNFLRKLDIAKGQYNRVAVYGMPQWMDYERIDFDYYEKLNVHVSSSVFIDDLNPDIRAFKRRYYDRFGDIPNEEAFSAYDLTRYFGRMIHRYGTRFQYKLESSPESFLHTEFKFNPVFQTGTTGTEIRQVDHWENQFVNILRFQNYRFSKVN